MKFLATAAFGALAFAPAAMAQTAPAPAASASAGAATPTVGATVYDSAGAVLGTIEQVTPQAVMVNMGTAKVGLPPSAIGAGPRGLQVGATRAAIEAQAKGAAEQQLATQLVAGATVRGAAGASVGTIKAVDADLVTLTTPRGDVKLPRAGFGAGTDGPVIGMTAAQLDAAITQAGGAAASTPAADATTAATPTSTPTAEAGARTDAAVAAGAATAGAATATKATTKTQTRRRTRSTRRTRNTSR